MGALSRSRLVELRAPECWAHLRAGQHGVGRVGLGGERPAILPVNYVLDGSGIVLQTGSESIVSAAEAGQWLAFQIDEVGRAGEASAEAWSVLARGPSAVVDDADQRTWLRLARLEPAAGGFKPTFVRIAVAELTGRARR